MSPSPREPESLAEGTLISHLLELRDRLLRAVIAVAIAFVPLAFFSNQLFTLVAQPLIDKLPEGTSLIATSVVAPFMTPLKLSLIAAIFVAMPYILYQVVGLRGARPVPPREALRAAAVRLERGAVLHRRRVRLLRRVPADVRVPHDDHPGGREDDDGHGELPRLHAAAVLRVRHRVRDAGRRPCCWSRPGSSRSRRCSKNRGYVLLGIFVVAAFLTPPDAISQSFMAVPMYILYEFGILFAQYPDADGAPPTSREPTRRRDPVSEPGRRLLRPPARARHALLHGDVGALHVLRHARPARAVPGRRGGERRLRTRRQDRDRDLRPVHGRRVHGRAARRLDRGPADRRAARGAGRRRADDRSAT